MANAKPWVRGVVLDVDGTLVDSNDAHAQAWVEALAEAGHHVPFDRVRTLIGMGGDKILPELAGVDEDSDEGRQINGRRAEIFRSRHLPDVRAFSHAGDLLRRMRAEGLDLVVASSAKEAELEPLLALTGAADALRKRTSSDDVERSKPDPDALHAALGALGREPREVVMIGDTPYDLEAAKRTGVAFIGFRSGGWPDLARRGAAEVYDGPWDLLERYDASMLARRTERGD